MRCTWTGFLGAPGYTTLYFDGSASPPPTANIRIWFFQMNSLFPNVVTIQVPGTGDTLDDATGLITGSWSTATPAAVTGVVAGVYAAPTGFIANHNTNGVIAGRRLRGRSFLVPAAGTAYDTNGTLTATALSAAQGASTTFLAAVTPQFVVWHRPIAHAGGSTSPVTAIVVPDKACVLRSRRD